MSNAYELTLFDYLSIMRRSKLHLLGTFVAVFLISIIAAVFMPRTYQSTGTIMVESQEVPQNVVATAAEESVDERINNIKQRVLTRDSLLKIANKYNLFKGGGLLTSSELIDQMRDRVGVELINIDTVQGNRPGKLTISFNLSFEDKNPQIAYNVTNDLVALFLNWNVKLRTERATETTIFLSQEADKLKLELERTEGLVSAYKQQHSGALPEQLNLRMTLMQTTENELREIERDYRTTKEEIETLQTELSAAKYGTGSDPSTSLPALKAELTRLSSIYNDTHPDIKALKRKIAALETSGNTPAPEIASAPSSATTMEAYKIQAKIDSDNETLKSLAQQRKILHDKIAQNESSMIQAPGVEQGLDMLISERDSAQKKYEEIINKQQSATIAENMEAANKSERFILLEPPVVPEKPFKPKPVKIVALGFFLAIASSGGMLMAISAFDSQIRGAGALEHVLGSRPLFVIPYLFLQEEVADRKRKLKIAIVAAILAVFLIALAIHFFYMPLNDLIVKILVTFV